MSGFFTDDCNDETPAPGQGGFFTDACETVTACLGQGGFFVDYCGTDPENPCLLPPNLCVPYACDSIETTFTDLGLTDLAALYGRSDMPYPFTTGDEPDTTKWGNPVLWTAWHNYVAGAVPLGSWNNFYPEKTPISTWNLYENSKNLTTCDYDDGEGNIELMTHVAQLDCSTFPNAITLPTNRNVGSNASTRVVGFLPFGNHGGGVIELTRNLAGHYIFTRTDNSTIVIYCNMYVNLKSSTLIPGGRQILLTLSTGSSGDFANYEFNFPGEDWNGENGGLWTLVLTETNWPTIEQSGVGNPAYANVNCKVTMTIQKVGDPATRQSITVESTRSHFESDGNPQFREDGTSLRSTARMYENPNFVYGVNNKEVGLWYLAYGHIDLHAEHDTILQAIDANMSDYIDPDPNCIPIE